MCGQAAVFLFDVTAASSGIFHVQSVDEWGWGIPQIVTSIDNIYSLAVQLKLCLSQRPVIMFMNKGHDYKYPCLHQSPLGAAATSLVIIQLPNEFVSDGRGCLRE